MKILVLANDELKTELLSQGIDGSATIDWFSEIHEIGDLPADACIDLLFSSNGPERIAQLQQLPAKLLVVNDVMGVTIHQPGAWVRINGWPGFLKRTLLEASTAHEEDKDMASAVFSCFQKKPAWTSNMEGFITPRIICSIINEAYFALAGEVSTREDIDIAMKMGTNYPHGPFEWCKLIGARNVYNLLKELSRSDERYLPADLLKNEAIS